MNFKKFNVQRLFDVDTSEFDYIGLDEAAEKYGEGNQILVKGVYINEKSQFGPAPLVATEEEYINLPQHQLDKVREMLANGEAIKAINRDELAIVIESYYQRRFGKTCYKAVWDNYDPASNQP